MLRFIAAIVAVSLGIASVVVPPTRGVFAQAELTARTQARVNLRPAPSTEVPALTQLLPGGRLILEARSIDSAWVLAHTPEYYWRGWVSADALTYDDGVVVDALPISDERLIAEVVAGSDAEQPTYVYESLDVMDYPIIPQDMGRAATIYQAGLAQGRDPRMLSKVGDCNTAGWVFLHPFGEGRYDLGTNTGLADVIAYYADAFDLRTYAAHNGLNVGAVLDPTWAEPAVCQPGESPLACEYRLHNPSVAVIMFGTNDLLVLNALQFDYFLRRVVAATIDAGIVPLMSTFPEYVAYPDRTWTFNQIVLQVAHDYDVPVMNLWRALEDLPSDGIAADGFHLNGPLTGAGDLTLPNLETGFPVRNLVTLQALDVLRQHLSATLVG